MLKKKEQRQEGQLECYTLPDDCRKNAKEKRTATGWQPLVPQSDWLAARRTPMTDRLPLWLKSFGQRFKPALS